jgi:threonine synthase
MLDILRKSGGTAVSVTDSELVAAVKDIGSTEGIFAAPEGAACLPALQVLIKRGEIKKDERIVLFNTGAGVKYLEVFN